MELDRCSQQGSAESPPSSLRGLGSASLPTASNDNLTADTGSRDASRISCFLSILQESCGLSSRVSSPPIPQSLSNTPPPLPEKKMVNRTVSAPDSAIGRPFVRAYPRLPFTGSESNVCRPADADLRNPGLWMSPENSRASGRPLPEQHHLLLLPQLSVPFQPQNLALQPRNPLRFEESNWSLFRLTSNKPSCNSGDAVYYSAACASDPSNSYAVKICKSPSADAKQVHLYGLSVQQSMPPHFNLQQDCGHFLASLCAWPKQVERERVVVITPEIPRQTAADLSGSGRRSIKLSQKSMSALCHGLEHLKEHGVTHRDICLENLLLVPHLRRPSQFSQQTSSENSTSSSGVDSQRHLPRLLISNFAKAKRRSSEDAASTSVDPRFKRDHARLAPEIVSAAQYRKFDEFQTGILIYELLHQANPFEVSPALKEQDYRCEELPPIPSVSLYSAGLQRLAQLLLQPDPIKRIHIQEAKRILQSLLRHEGLLNWLDVKRALLMMKFAERSLEPERNAELEDWLCCQYFSSAHPLSLCHTAELLYSLK
ncbi:hypothetical protein KUCAC02_009100 [Chaenocephalus aceratus]|uniref:Uncharacterized protein n=1 Tax=Chaenocephalus aceratus TaxID=36190 RepID=A0ACB9WST6_CHAAC|nr:hypothetical protein KUCAC02_009100 [Chaenocephalus aceratus]